MKIIKVFQNVLFAAILILMSNVSFAQNTMDTVKPGNSNDPMVVDPGKGGDSMAMKPGKTNDAIAAFTDTGFISKNIMDNIMEIRLAKYGQTKATDMRVKKVAALMVKDHTAILSDLKDLAAKKGVSPSSYSRDISSSPLIKTSGKNFDKNWSSEMLTMHEAKIAELENYINLSADEDIKAAAGKALQKIKAHRDMLTKIAGTKSKMRLI